MTDCGHICCDHREDPHHDHFLSASRCCAGRKGVLADAIERHLNGSAWVATPRGIAQAVAKMLTEPTHLPAGWLTPLLTEVSAAIHGRGSLDALEECVRQVPEEYLEAAGLRWALSSFDDQAPTVAQIETARNLIGDAREP